MDFLFDGDNAEEDVKELKVNTRFASQWEKKMRDQRIAKLEAEVDALEKSIESDEEHEDEVGELVTGKISQDFLEAYVKIRDKDPSLYAKETQFFTDAGELVPAVKNVKKEEEQKPAISVAEYALREANESSEEDKKEGDMESLPYVKQQEELKRELKEAIEKEEQNSDGDDLLVLKVKGADEEKKMEEEYKEFLAKQKEGSLLF